jgi:SAM-dependent methyltransferase
MELIVNRCKLCGTRLTEVDHKLRFNGNYEIIFCSTCKTGITRLQPEQKKERESINKEVYNLIGRLDSYFGRRIEFNRRYQQCLSMIQSHAPVISALDIGCSIGYWLHFLRKKGITDIIGIEINDECRMAAREIFGIETYPHIQNIDRTFDLVSFNDVLEHLDNPLFFLTQTLSLAHPDTIYFLQLPNYQSNMARWLGRNWPWWSVPDHLWHFNPHSITHLLEKAGLQVIELKTCDVVYDLIEYISPQWMRPFMRPLRYIHRTSGYINRGSNNGGLIKILARRKEF